MKDISIPTPVRFSLNADAAECLAAVDTWVGLLACENYEAAYAFTEHDTQHEWTPELIRNVIYGYGFPVQLGEKIYKVTPIATARFPPDELSQHRYRELNQNEDPWPYPHDERAGVAVVGEVWYSLPLNGLWSDVTATFNLLQYPDHLTLELQEIHVF